MSISILKNTVLLALLIALPNFANSGVVTKPTIEEMIDRHELLPNSLGQYYLMISKGELKWSVQVNSGKDDYGLRVIGKVTEASKSRELLSQSTCVSGKYQAVGLGNIDRKYCMTYTKDLCENEIHPAVDELNSVAGDTELNLDAPEMARMAIQTIDYLSELGRKDHYESINRALRNLGAGSDDLFDPRAYVASESGTPDQNLAAAIFVLLHEIESHCDFLNEHFFKDVTEEKLK